LPRLGSLIARMRRRAWRNRARVLFAARGAHRGVAHKQNMEIEQSWVPIFVAIWRYAAGHARSVAMPASGIDAKALATATSVSGGSAPACARWHRENSIKSVAFA
jgi:hypothetical protein